LLELVVPWDRTLDLEGLEDALD